MQNKLSVVILNWNGKHLLEEYLPSVVKYSLGYEVVVADNGSDDDSVEMIKKKFPTVRIIALDKNYGFTGGYNRALSQIDSDFFVLLNDDVLVTHNWIKPVLNLMLSDEKIAVCQPKLLSYTQKDMFEYAGAAGGYIDYLGYPFCAGRVFNHLEKDLNQYDQVREIFWASGAAMFVRSDVFRQLGGLDEDFFAHMEEIDFCWRAKNKGYKIMYCPDSEVFHLGAGTLKKTSSRKTFLNFRNNLLLLYKNLPENKVDKILKKRKYLDLLAAFVFLITSSKSEYKAVIKARKEFNKIKKQFDNKRDNKIKDYPSCVYTKSLVISSKIKHLNHFSRLKKFIKWS